MKRFVLAHRRKLALLLGIVICVVLLALKMSTSPVGFLSELSTINR